MKKLLGILVLGLLLAGCVTGGGPGNVVKQQDDYIHLGYEGWFGYLHDANKEKAVAYCSNRDKYAFHFYDQVGNSAAIFICSEKFLSESPISGNMVVWSNYPEELREKEELARITKKRAELKEQETTKKKVELLALINEAKSICKELDFKEGTEKFSDCALKLYTQKIDQTSKQKETVIVQTQASSGSMTIYDPVRDNQRMIDQGMKMLSGRCTLGIDC